VNLAPSNSLLKLSPGHPIELRCEGGGLKVFRASGEYVGRVESRLASRLARLIRGGNRYDATVRIPLIIIAVLLLLALIGAVSDQDGKDR